MKKDSKEYLSLLKEAESENTSGDRLKELAELNDDLAEIVASNIAASPELLHILAFHESRSVKKAVVSNSNTPIEPLLKLGIYFPKEILNNHIFQYYASKKYQKYDLLRSIPLNVLYVLIQQNNVPQFVLTHARYRQEKHIFETAMLQTSVTGEITEGWHQLAEDIISEGFFSDKFMDNFNGVVWDFTQGIRSSGNPNKPKKSFQILTNFYKFIPSECPILKNPVFKRNVAQNPNMIPTVLEVLSGDENYLIRMDVAANVNTPDNALELLANDTNNYIRSSVATNPNTPIEILKLFAKSANYKIRYCVGGNSSTSTELLKLLADDSNESVRMSIASNHNTPTKLLKLLANDSNESVRKYVAENPGTPIEILTLLSKDSSISVLRSVAKNTNTPAKILNSFANNSNLGMRQCLAVNPTTPAKILRLFVKNKEYDSYYAALKNPNLPLDILKLFAKDSDDKVRECVTDNPSTPAEILRLLAKDSNSRIRVRVARHPNTTIETLKLLSKDYSKEIRGTVAKNTNTSLRILRILANDADYSVRDSVSEHPECTFEIKEIIFRNFAKAETPSFNRVALFMSDYAESSVLAENSNSISWLERYAIACNQKTPTDTLKQLAKDGNRIVRATAKESLEKK